MKNFEVNQVLKLPTNKEYVAYPIEGVRQLALDNKPSNVKVFISQNSMRQNARELRNRDDGYAELPDLIDKLYLFSEGINENGFIQINYTGNSGNYYKYGNDTIAQIDKIDSVREVENIKSVEILKNLSDEIKDFIRPPKLFFRASYVLTKLKEYLPDYEDYTGVGVLDSYEIFDGKKRLFSINKTSNFTKKDGSELDNNWAEASPSIQENFKKANFLKSTFLDYSFLITTKYGENLKRAGFNFISNQIFFMGTISQSTISSLDSSRNFFIDGISKSRGVNSIVEYYKDNLFKKFYEIERPPLTDHNENLMPICDQFYFYLYSQSSNLMPGKAYAFSVDELYDLIGTLLITGFIEPV